MDKIDKVPFEEWYSNVDLYKDFVQLILILFQLIQAYFIIITLMSLNNWAQSLGQSLGPNGIQYAAYSTTVVERLYYSIR